MNNTFDFNRFSLLVKRQWIENKKLFLMASVILLGLGIVFYSFNMSFITGKLINGDARMVILTSSFFVVGTFFTNYILKDFSNKNSGTNFLLIPASHLEKLLNVAFYTFIIFPIVYWLLSYTIDFAFVSIGNNIMSNYDNVNGLPLVEKNEFWLNASSKKDTWSKSLIFGIWLIVQSPFVLGSIIFEGWAYIKTGFAGIIIFFLIYLIAGIAFEILVTDMAHQVEVNSSSYLQIKPTRDSLENMTILCLKYVFTPILLLITYFKLKEKQV